MKHIDSKKLFLKILALSALIFIASSFSGCMRYRPSLLISFTKEGEEIRVKKLTEGAFSSWSPDGKKIVYQDRGIWIMDIQTMKKKKVTNAGSNPSWSPDGSMIAYVYNGIWIWDRNTGTHSLLAQQGDHPCWSLDGSKLAFSHQGIWTMDIDGSNKTRLLQTGIPLSFSPNGSTLLCEQWEPDHLTFYLSILDLSALEQRRLVDGTKGSFSPDGASMVYSNDGIWLYSATNKDSMRITMGGYDPKWSPTGENICFSAKGKIWLMDAPYKAIPLQKRYR